MPFFRCSFLIILLGNTDTIGDKPYARCSRNAGKRYSRQGILLEAPGALHVKTRDRGELCGTNRNLPFWNTYLQ